MANVSGTVGVNAGMTQVVSSGVITNQNLPASITQAISYTSGTGAGQVNLCYAKRLTLNATPTTLDLTSLSDLSGSTVSFARVREFILMNNASTGGYVCSVGSAGASAFVGFQTASAITLVHPSTTSSITTQNALRWSDATNVGASSGAVTGASNKQIKLDPGSNSFTVDVLILGCDATS